MADTIVTVLRVQGANAYANSMRTASGAVRQLGYDTRSTTTAGKAFERSMIGVQGIMNTALSAATGLGKGVILLGGLGVAAGFQFNAGMERAQIGMKTLLGSGKEARTIVEEVTDFAREAPLFGIEDMLQAAQQLIGVGFDAKKIVPTLTTFSDTLSAMGRKPEDLLRMRYAFSQMASKGTVSAEELRGQLGEIFPAMQILAKEMGISVGELRERMKEGAVGSDKAIKLLLRGMDKRFGGATKKMNKTWTGQWKALQENAKVALGGITKNTQFWLTREIMPELNRFVSAVGDVWTNQNMTAQQKWNRTRQLARQILGPLGTEIRNKLKQAHIGQTLSRAIEAAMPKIMNAMAAAAPGAARKFLNAWWHADAWGKILTVAVLATKFGVFAKLGGWAGKKFIDRFVKFLGAEWAASQLGQAVAPLGTKMGTRMGKAASTAFAVALVAGVALMGATVLEALRGLKKNTIDPWIEDQFGPAGSVYNDIVDAVGQSAGKFVPGLDIIFGKRPGEQTGGMISRAGTHLVGERGPELVHLPTGARVTPNAAISASDRMIQSPMGRIEIPVILHGREIARAVHDDTANRIARR
jgi:tape measure domain-containing protein